MRGLTLTIVLFGAAIGCAARSAEPQAPAGAPTQPERAPITDLDALEHDLSVAEQRLDAEVEKKVATLGRARDVRLEEKDAETETPSAEKKSEGRTAPHWDEAELATPCDSACRALASMKRSAERICEIAGESDSRCSTAKSRVARAEERVRKAGCVCREREGE